MRTLLEIKRKQITEREISASVAIKMGKQILMTENPTLFGRSLTKPFQMKAVQSVLANELDWKQKAVALASHNGDDVHIESVRSILPASEHGLLTLLPSPAIGGRKIEPSIWTNPCSGKHSAILLACRKNGWPMNGYTDVEHPYNKAYLEGLELRLGTSVRDRTVAPDGCLLPTYAMSVGELASLYQSIATEKDQDWIWEAAHRNPELIGGNGRLDTRILQTHESVFAKEGADGLLGLAIRGGDRAIGVVIKIAHGHDPANAERFAQPILEALGFNWPMPLPPSGQTVQFTPEYSSFIESVRRLTGG